MIFTKDHEEAETGPIRRGGAARSRLLCYILRVVCLSFSDLGGYDEKTTTTRGSVARVSRGAVVDGAGDGVDAHRSQCIEHNRV